jgi:glycosyltransferase involved in cell wall biosynthesis
MKVAAVIPARNRAHTIRRAIQSALDQTYRLSEIIVVDDGSADGTVDVVRSFNDPRIRLIQQDQRGACAARNIGWQSTDADWIGFLDSDDVWMPAKIAAQMECCGGKSAETISACFTGFRNRDADSSYPSDPMSQFISIDGLKMGNGLGPTSICLVRRSALVEVGGWDESLLSCQDWDLWLKLSKVGSFAVIPVCLVEFHQDSRDRISHNVAALKEGHRIVFKRVLRDVSKSERALVSAMHAVRMSHMMSSIGRRRSAIYFALKSLLLRPNLHALALVAKNLS